VKIQLKLFAGLRVKLPPSAERHLAELDVPVGATVLDVLRRLEVPPEQGKLILINGRHAELNSRLAPGDLLAVFPPVGGG